ncbi:CHAD domain-containing protein [Spirosoma koreense]
MAYVFKQDESIAHNLDRILSQEVKAALDALQKPDQATGEAIHSIRKRIKKIRALFRLVRSGMNEKDFRRQNSFYRTIGQQLSPLRDATVMIRTLDKLQQAHPRGVSTQVFTSLRKTLIQEQDEAVSQFFDDPTQVGGVTRTFELASRKIVGLSKRHKGFGSIAPNLKAVYRRARHALAVAIDKPSIDHFHELRKDVKTLWYHTRLLEPIWPGLFKAYGHELGRLGELLGDDHDYGVLAQLIESDRLSIRRQLTKEALWQGLQAQRHQLQEQIYPLARRLLAEKPGSFVKRYRRSWKLWRSEAHQITIAPRPLAT